MADLTDDYQFELDGVLFGRSTTIFVEEDGFSPGRVDWRTQDAEVPQGDGVMFGRDFAGAPTWAWNLGIDRDNETEVLADQSRLTAVWRADKHRRTPGAVAALRYRLNGRVRRVYGRPRALAPSFDNRFSQGYIGLVADFRCADHLHYDDDLKSNNIPVGEITQVGGFKEPLSEPIMDTRTTTAARAGGVDIGGDAPTWILVKFEGPISNPYVEADNGLWRIQLNTSIASGESITIDPRPWARTVLRSDGASVAGTLNRGSRLQEMSLAPGPHVITFGGSAQEPGSSTTVSWRDASYSL